MSNHTHEQRKMLKHIPLSAADVNLQFYCSSDSSMSASSFLVYQIIKTGLGDKDTTIDYIGCSSRLFSRAERSYSSFKLEVLGLLSGLSSYDYILRYAHSIITIMDARSILFL